MEERLKALCNAHTPFLASNVIKIDHYIVYVWWDGEEFLVGERPEDASTGKTIEQASERWLE